jgi:hypothetical protein
LWRSTRKSASQSAALSTTASPFSVELSRLAAGTLREEGVPGRDELDAIGVESVDVGFRIGNASNASTSSIVVCSRMPDPVCASRTAGRVAGPL